MLKGSTYVNLSGRPRPLRLTVSDYFHKKLNFINPKYGYNDKENFLCVKFTH